VDEAEACNHESIWPDKVRINREYIRDWRLRDDLKYVWRTVVG
jgi:lipopolysaccharide/colanic/teichoic acid biosynthesis glycosyltransferase